MSSGSSTLATTSSLPPQRRHGSISSVRVPDVAWASPEFIARHGVTTPFPSAPEICAEAAGGAACGEARSVHRARPGFITAGTTDVS
jgi:hypothetical protein